ncbi:MAG: ribulokinase [Planctomycetes bacterium]|nr:ribulokinase [Planctomycetota bacterium]
MQTLFLGLDFGTESVRAILLGADGSVAGIGFHAYEHGVLERALPNGAVLAPESALQVATDYLNSAQAAIAASLAAARATGDRVAGIGVDFTACTALPVGRDGGWLGARAEFADDPHAYVKLWKHHGANREAEDINNLARRRNEPWLARFGNNTSSEWLHAKWLETYRKSPRVAAAASRFVEAGDWIVERMTGARVKSACMAGYKGLNARNAAAPRDFFEALDPGFAQELYKLDGPLVAPGARAGILTADFAKKSGLRKGTPVSAALIDAHAAVPGLGIAQPGILVIILGTSACHMLLDTREACVPGIQGVVQDGIVPGVFAYEAGQAAVGDLYAWAARATNRNITDLETEAARTPAGGTGLLVLDWWNGNRSVLVNPNLSGLVVGLTLATSQGELYRAIVEGSAFGTRAILEAFESQGVHIQQIAVCGGIAEKSPFVLQTFSNVTGRPILKPEASEVCARGAAICGATAAGAFADLTSAAAAMGGKAATVIAPDAALADRYQLIYKDWSRLHDQFGRDPDLMARLRAGRLIH